MIEEPSHPIEGQVVLLAGAKASVSLTRLSDLLSEAQEHLADEIAEYERRFERIDGCNGSVYFLAEEGHWERLGTELGFTNREAQAVGRTHKAQFERDGRRMDRQAEFETTLEIRDIVAVTPAD